MILTCRMWSVFTSCPSCAGTGRHQSVAMDIINQSRFPWRQDEHSLLIGEETPANSCYLWHKVELQLIGRYVSGPISNLWLGEPPHPCVLVWIRLTGLSFKLGTQIQSVPRPSSSSSRLLTSGHENLCWCLTSGSSSRTMMHLSGDIRELRSDLTHESPAGGEQFVNSL